MDDIFKNYNVDENWWNKKKLVRRDDSATDVLTAEEIKVILPKEMIEVLEKLAIKQGKMGLQHIVYSWLHERIMEEKNSLWHSDSDLDPYLSPSFPLTPDQFEEYLEGINEEAISLPPTEELYKQGIERSKEIKEGK